LTAERLIRGFYRPLGEQTDEAELESLLQTLENESETILFDGQTLRNLEASGKIVPYLSSILAASTLPSEKASKRRGFCFLKAIALLKGGHLSQSDSREIFDRLLANIRLLKENQAANCIDKVLDEFNPTDPNSLTGHGMTLEMLWQLAAIAGPTRRPYIIQKLRDMAWPKSAVAMLSATLVEICESEAECESCIHKIQEHLAWDQTSIRQSNGATGAGAISTSARSCDKYVDVEELPTLLYQVTNLTKKCDGALIRGLIVETVTDALDSLLWASYRSDEVSISNFVIIV
jgi:hypothetical protein